MRQLATLFTFIVLFISNTFAQDYDVEWGPSYTKDGGMFSTFSVLGSDEDYYYISMRPKKSNTLLTYDYNHKLVRTKELSFEVDGKDAGYPYSLIETSTATYAKFSIYNKKEKTWTYYSSVFSKGEFGPLVEDSKDGVIKEMKYRDIVAGKTGSPDKSIFATVVSYSLENKKQPDHLDVEFFNDKLELVSKGSYSIPNAEDDLDFITSVVSNEGSLFLVAKRWKEKDERTKDTPNYDYQVFQFVDGEIDVIEIDLGADIVPQEANLFLTENNTAKLGGFYTKREKGSRVNGVFFVNIDFATGETITSSEEFSDEFLTDLIGEKAIEKGKGVSSRYDIDHLITFDDGSFSFLAEEYYTITHTYTTSDGGTRTTTTYHSNAIIIPRFKEDGTLVSLEVIKKSFASSSPLVVSYSFATVDGKIFLIYNDFKNKEERKDMNKKDGKRARYTDLTVINEDGTIGLQKTLFSSVEIETEFRPFLTFEANNELIIGGLRKKEYQFGTLVEK